MFSPSSLPIFIISLALGCLHVQVVVVVGGDGGGGGDVSQTRVGCAVVQVVAAMTVLVPLAD